MVLSRQRRLDRPASLVSKDEKSGVRRWIAAILHRAHHLGRDDVPGHTHDEQLAEAGIENQLGRHARVAAADDGGEGALGFGELGQDLLLHRRKPRFATDEAFVARHEALQRVISGVGGG